MVNLENEEDKFLLNIEKKINKLKLGYDLELITRIKILLAGYIGSYPRRKTMVASVGSTCYINSDLCS